MGNLAQTDLQKAMALEVNMSRVTYGTCGYCHNRFTVGDWYDFLNMEKIQDDAPWTCPGCKKKLKTTEITVSYDYEGDS